MKLNFKRFLSSILMVLVVSLFSINVIANTDNVTEIEGAAKYYVEETLETNNLANGVIHNKQISFTSAAAGRVTNMGTGVNEPFVPDKFYQQQVNVLEVASSTDIFISPWAITGSSNWTLNSVRDMAHDFEAKNPGFQVVAAINGDFYDINSNQNFPLRPSGVHVSGGDFYKSSGSRNIGFLNDGSTDSLVGDIATQRTSKMQLDIYDDNDEITNRFEIDKINQVPGDGEVAIYYANLDKEHKANPVQVENGFVVANADYAFPISTNDFYGVGTISAFGNRTLNANQFALVSNNPELTEQLGTGVKVRAQFEFAGAWEGVDSAIGAGITFLRNGGLASSDTNRHPRTIIGAREDGTIIMAVVDGRQAADNMYGVASAEMAAVLKHYGAVSGYNLDGGGSSTMLIRNDDGTFRVVNQPSDGVERRNANGLMVAVRVPIIEDEVIDVKPDGFTINVKELDKNGLDFDKLYVGVADQKVEVVKGKAVINGLDNDSRYEYEYYRKVDDEFQTLRIEGRASTAKQLPLLEYAELHYLDDDLLLNLYFDDPDNAIRSRTVYINDEFVPVINNAATVKDFVDSIESILIGYTYDLNDGQGRIEVEVADLSFRYNVNLIMKITTEKMAEKLSTFFK